MDLKSQLLILTRNSWISLRNFWIRAHNSFELLELNL